MFQNKDSVKQGLASETTKKLEKQVSSGKMQEELLKCVHTEIELLNLKV